MTNFKMPSRAQMAGAVTGASVLVVESAHAALPTALTTGYTTATADFTDLFELFIPGMVLVSGSLLVWRYGKRFIKSL